METETSGAAEAIKEIERLSIEGLGPETIELEVPDGAGGTREVPVLIHEGEVVDLSKALESAANIARLFRTREKEAPGWRQGVARHQALESFIDHINRFKAAQSVVWANPAMRGLLSVLDYHPAGADSPAAWGRHRGIYACPLSEAWTAWGGETGLELGQEGFADLLDSRDYELAGGAFPGGTKEAPSPASLITLANNLEVYSTATAKRERDQNTGRVRISYSEDKGVSGAVMPPPAFGIRIPIFEDSAPQMLEVRLKVTVDNGQAQFALNIHAAREVLREAFAAICETVHAETDVPVFVGEPETAA